MTFSGLTDQHFDAYAEEKWSSNVHNLARMQAKEAMLALSEDIASSNAFLAGLKRSASDEIPNIANQKKVDAQWIYWFRSEAERKELSSLQNELKLDASAFLEVAPQDRHITLAVVLRQNALTISVRVALGAKVDRKNLGAKLKKDWERETLLELLKELPEGGHWRFGDNKKPTSSCEADDLMNASNELEDHATEWAIEYVIERSDALTDGADIAAQAATYLEMLWPIYQYACWSRSNDHIEAGKQLQKEKAEKRKQASGFRVGDKVRVISGLFSGKVGVVQETDTKAKVRVKVGKMSVVLPGTDLTPAH